jgi:hypothetical protein
MNGSEKFKTRIEDFLSEKSVSDPLFAPMLAKTSKNVENCLKYIISEVKKTGFCAFDDSEIFDMAVKYYTDDTIGIPPEIKCRVTVNQPQTADLFSAPPAITQNAVQNIPVAKTAVVASSVKAIPKHAQTTLTLFDL